MDWSIIEKVTRHPAFLAVLSILSLVVGAYAILSKTSLGKKAISKLTDLARRADEKADRTRSLVNEQIENIEGIKNEVIDFKKEIVNEVKVYFSQLEFFEKGLYNILSQVPNAKVQAEVTKFYGEWNEKKKEIQEFVGSSFTNLDESIKELKDQKDTEIATLKDEIEKLKELVKESLKTKETVENGETKEGIDDQAAQE